MQIPPIFLVGCRFRTFWVYLINNNVFLIYFYRTLIFEEITSGNKTTLEICGGFEKPKTFPIKTNYSSMSWVRAGRKELSLKNATNKKIYIRCQIMGEGFAIDLPRESRGIYCVPFGPCECRPLPIVYSPTTNAPQKATLRIVFEKNSECCRKVSDLFWSLD